MIHIGVESKIKIPKRENSELIVHSAITDYP